MKLKKKFIRISIINYIYFLLVSFQLLFKNIYCDTNDITVCNSCMGSNQSCPSDCRYSIYKGSYILCNGISSSSDRYYYLKQKMFDSVSFCNTIEACPHKIVYKTNECVPDCNGLNEVGDFCYLDGEADFDADKYELIGLKKYKCKEYTKVVLIGETEREFHICIEDPQRTETDNTQQISVNQKCDTLYYDFDEKKCVESCVNKKITIRTGTLLNEGQFTYYECRNECESEENNIEYNESDDNEGSTDIYCLSECPNTTPFYYEKTIYQNSKCLKECDKNHFYDSSKKCHSSCDNNKVYYLKDNTKDSFFCDGDDCPTSSHPYRYKNKNFCLRSCSETSKLSIVNNKTTYAYIDENGENKKYCVEDCYIENPEYYSDDESSTCVKSCSTTIENIYHYNHKCYHSCTDIIGGEYKYYIKTFYGSENYPSSSNQDGDEDITTYEDLECVKECPNGFYKYLDACVKYCPKSSETPYINITTKECTSCKIPKDYSNIKKGEGFIKQEDNSDNLKYNIICYKECPPDTYYKINDNICIPLSEASNDDNCKFPEGNSKICYPSCSDIKKYISGKEYTFESKNICYEKNSNINCGDLYYYEKNGFTKCIDYGNEIDEIRKKYMVIRECENQNLVYLKEKKCVGEGKCDKGDYIIMPEESIYKGIIELGKCCKEANCDANYPYYSETEKILKKECSLKTIEKIFDNQIGVSKEGTYVSECPPDYPYESEDEKICLSKCSNSFYEVEITKKYKCVDSCESINRYYFEDDPNKECLTNCSLVENNQRTYYYYDDSKICYKSCKDKINKDTFQYSLNATNFPQKCLSICPEGYYYNEKDYICKRSCDSPEHYKSSSNICVYQCESAEFLSSNNKCVEKCSPTESFFILDDNNNKKCVMSCEKEDSKYKFYNYKTGQCLEKCPLDAKYENGNQCRDQCPDGYYVESNKCKMTCDESSYFVLEEEEKVFKCVPNCDLTNYYVSSSTGECVKTCGRWENYIGKNKICKEFCEEEDGKYFKKLETINVSDQESYNLYQCLDYVDSSEYHVHGTNEIVSECPDSKPYLSKNGNICYSKCTYDENLAFSTEEEVEDGDTRKIKICSYECKGTKKYYGEDKICHEDCNSYEISKIINEENNECVSKCDSDSLFKFETKIPGKDNQLYCSKQCSEVGVDKYSENDYKCVKECYEPYNYQYGNKCLYECPKETFILQKYENNENLYECVEQCNETYVYYYKKDKKCISKEKCDYIIEGTNECTSNCSSIKGYSFYENEDSTEGTYQNNFCVIKCPPEKPFLKQNNHCDKYCPQYSPYFIEGEEKCLMDCPNKMVKYGNFCKYTCDNDTYLEPKTKKCVKNCAETRFKYFYTPNNTCVENCGNLLYNGSKCVEYCPIDDTYDNGTTKLYYINPNNECSLTCPETHKYIIDKFTHNENDTKKICLRSCPIDYRYYIPYNDLFKCVGTCLYYVLPRNFNENSTIQCYDEDNGNENNKCPTTHPYFVKYDNGTNQCFNECPNDKLYYDNNYQCYEKCPEIKPYHNLGSYECIGDCETKTIDYEKNECVVDCPFYKKYALDGDKKFCLNKCNIEFGEYLKNDRECVKECGQNPDDNLVKIIIDSTNKKCECVNLYYIANDGSKTCFIKEENECGMTGSNHMDYKFRKFGTNECSKNCLGFSSPSKDICYYGYQNCEDIDNNTGLVFRDNMMICDCKYKFYYYTDPKTQKTLKICLGKNEDCSIVPYLSYTPETRECVQSECPKDGYKFSFENKCFSKCPIQGLENIEIKEQCKCENDKYLTKIGDSNYKCDTKCEIGYPYIIEIDGEAKKCVDKCKGSGYEILYNNKCYLSCSLLNDGKMDIIEIEDSLLKEIATYTCQCKSNWFFNEKTKKEECVGDKKCSEIEVEADELKYNYIIKDTKECVKICPFDYKTFNNECFKSCEDVEDIYHYPVKDPSTSDSKECECANIWKKNEDGEKICLKDFVCENLMINETKECVDKCNSDYPLLFNKQCFKKGSCPEEAKEDIINGDKCICKKVWYGQKNGNMKCIDSDECPDNFPYKIFGTNECVYTPCSKLDLKYYVNNTCYEKCPDGTVENSKDHYICECDPKFGFWEIREKEKKKIMICGKSNCPSDKKYYRNDTKECLSNCIENNLYQYKNTCYVEECPYPTVSENVELNKYECTVKKYTTAKNLSESYKFLKDELIGLFNSIPKGGIIYNNFSSTMQVYGIKKEENDTKDLVLRSSLSYIDISSCKDKVFENNKMKDDAQIIVVKYDLGNQTTKSIVNPVEYEFVNSKTGQILDMSACKKNDVIISYSLSDILNYNVKKKKRNLEENNNIEEDEEIDNIILQIQNQYNKGKELFNQYNFDTFNINSTIYNDRCFSFEINGKDLTLEDRVNYLYPYYSLCEANCSYASTDFILERIYCNCPLKKEFDFERDQKFVINDNNIQEIKSKQKGPSNIPVMECINALNEKKNISNNGGFFYSLGIMLLEICLFFITIFYCYKKLKNKINKNYINSKEEKEKIFDENGYKNQEITNKDNDKYNNNEIIYKTSERALTAPPRKKEIVINEIDPNDIQLESKIRENEKKQTAIIKDNDGKETEDPRLNNEEEGEGNKDNGAFVKDYELGILNEIKKEEKKLRFKFELAMQRDKSDVFITLLTEICDKIYILKIILFLGKYDMPSIYYSLYLLYHLIYVTLITCFYDINTIHKIWIKENYPNLSCHLRYGFFASLVVWVFYRLFLCLLNNDNAIKKYMKQQIIKSTSSENDNLKENNRKFNNLLKKIKCGMIAYFLFQFIFIIVFLLYLTIFCAIYIGTKGKIFETYGIGLFEVFLIKLVYGIIIGIFRKVGIYKRKKVLYNIAYYLDKYIY